MPIITPARKERMPTRRKSLELPIMSGWDDRRLQISPCRFTGTLKGEDLVIMAHNYNSHFGRLSQLSEGSPIQFMDMDGNLWDYSVAAMDILPAEAVEESCPLIEKEVVK